jgi:cell division protein ZapA
MVKVTIFGNEYRVRGDADEPYIQEIADYVDGTMREIAGEGRHISPTRIAILAAFNIADELFRQRQGAPAGGAKVESKAAELLKLFEEEEI